MDQLEAACGPQLAASILKLAQNCNDEQEFGAKVGLFAKLDQYLLKAVWSSAESESAPATNGGNNERPGASKIEPTIAVPDATPTDSDDVDRDWYCDDPVQVEPEPFQAPAPQRAPQAPQLRAGGAHNNPKLRVYYHQPLADEESSTSKLVSVVRDPSGALAQQAKNGSETVRIYKSEQEKKMQARAATQVRGTLKALEVPRSATKTRASAARNTALEKIELPANQHKDQLMQAVRDNQVLIVVGETGSGKTTQIPQFLHEQGYVVACTQPRRVAAMSVADRVAAEQGCALGSTVGYSIRFEDRTSASTRIKFLTDGILLKEAQTDPLLEQYSCIIVDEAHERALNTDLLLGLFKRILQKRLDLKVIITSATINATLFSEFYGNAPVYTIPGRSFPVQIQNLKVAVSDHVQAAVKQALSIHLQMGTGDILVFMTGQDDIETTCHELEAKLAMLDNPPPLEILPIYSQLPQDLQAKIFEPSEHRKVVVATNIAETSLTIQGIKYVVDTGLTKVKVHQPKYGIDVLQLVPISKANANQRAGRAGRTSEGFAFRLYTKFAELEEMFDQPVPEISRSNLSSTLLLLKVLGVEDPNEFDFLDRPPQSGIDTSIKDLKVIGALDAQGALTELGARLGKFPLDPFMARMLVAGIDAGCTDEMLTIVAMMCVPPVFIRSNLRGKESDKQREKFQVPQSDHLTLCNVYREWVRNGRSKKWCQDNFLQPRSLVHAQEVRAQLERLVGPQRRGGSSSGISPEANAVAVRRCVCQAYFHQASRAKGLQTFVGLASGVELSLHPTSALFGLGTVPEYVVYNEVILTTKQYMMLVTEVEPEWLLEFGRTLYSSSERKDDAAADEPRVVKPKPRFKRQKTAPRVNKNLMRGI